MVTVNSAGTGSLILALIALAIQLAMVVIIFSLPGRFREQREYMDRKSAEIEQKLDALAAAQAALAQKLEEAAPVVHSVPPDAAQANNKTE